MSAHGITPERLLSAVEFADLEADGRAELVRGRVVKEPPPSYGHGAVQLRLGYLLTCQIERHGWRLECAVEAGCVVEEGPDTVRGPDVSVVRQGRRVGTAGWIAGAPELVAEVLSPSDRPAAVREKVREYLAAGSERVWIVDARRRTVTVHQPRAAPVTLGEDDVLDGGELMPGLQLRIADIFAR